MNDAADDEQKGASALVDRKARDQAAELLRKFIGGRITNDEFNDRAPETVDPVVDAIWDTAWLYYSDFKEHKLSGRDRLHPDARRAFVRWVLFLDSDLPYEWPPVRLPGNDPFPVEETYLWRVLRQWLGLTAHCSKEEKFANAGHYPVWPFISQKDYRSALRKPKRLSGSAIKCQ